MDFQQTNIAVTYFNTRKYMYQNSLILNGWVAVGELNV